MKPETEKLPYRIWFKDFDKDGKCFASGVLHFEYKREASAMNRAAKWFARRPSVRWVVSQTNPWVKEKNNET